MRHIYRYSYELGFVICCVCGEVKKTLRRLRKGCEGAVKR